MFHIPSRRIEQLRLLGDGVENRQHNSDRFQPNSIGKYYASNKARMHFLRKFSVHCEHQAAHPGLVCPCVAESMAMGWDSVAAAAL